FLRSENIQIYNGFSRDDSSEDMDWVGFDEVTIENAVPLVKLHGSITWVRFTNLHAYPSTLREVKHGEDIWHRINKSGDMERPDDGKPKFLIGTLNKLEAYNFDQYAELFTMFRRVLRKTDELIIVGYSFGDRAVNYSLASWLVSDASKRLLIIDPKIESIKENVREAFWWTRFNKSDPQISLIQDYVENVSVDEMLDKVAY
ncbi:SIR2 family protein, partial [bacterium AH-315-J21]|nr:SIR2 family protein [bacterium AH-315-J21]